MNKFVVGMSVSTLLAAIAIACGSGDTGATGPKGDPGAAGASGVNGAQGANGQNGTNGTAGTPGTPGASGEAGAPGGTVIISSRAKHGLDISPVPVNTAGLTGAQVEQIGQGSYLVNAIASCGDCHNSPTGKFLAGNVQFAAGPNTVYTRNLTPDPTTGLQLTEAQFIQALRTGMDFRNSPDGGTPTSLVVMPWPSFRWMSTADLKAIYAYLKAIPAENNAITADTKTAGPPVDFPKDYNESGPGTDRPLPPEVDAQGNPVPDPNNVLRGLAVSASSVNPGPGGANLTPGDFDAYGRGSYLVNAIASCNDCHSNPQRNFAPGATFLQVNYQQFLTGGQVFATPPPLQPIVKTTRSMSANLLGQGIGFFRTADFPAFLATITQGVHGDDPPPQAPLAWPMPAHTFKNMELGDLTAIYTYLRTVANFANLTDKNTRMAALYCAADADCTAAGQTCDTTNKECVNLSCTSDGDCPVCQSCVSGKCALPDAVTLGKCVATGL